MDVLQLSIAAMPFLLALMSRTGKAIAPCLLASLFTALPGGEPHRAVIAWCVGMPIATVALRERLRRRSGFPIKDIAKEKARRGGPVAPDFLLAGPGLRAPRCQALVKA